MKTYLSPKIGYLDGDRYQLAILSGCKQIIKHEKELNKLNVFPIPDHDTGSNLKKTLMPLVKKFPRPEPNINLISQEMADLTVQSAFGYSGIIFSQILLGFAAALRTHLRIRPGDLKIVVSNGVHKAYQSVEKPVEGTILSVLRVWSDEVTRICSQANDFVPILEISYQMAMGALTNTPNQLEVLRKNNVVDAGGKAFIYFLEGIHNLIKTGKRARISSDRIYAQEAPLKDRSLAPFCVECCIKAHKLNRKDLIKKLCVIGQDLIFYGAQHFAKFHLNTHNPEKVIACASLFGKISSKKIFSFSSDSSDREKLPFCLVADSTCDLMDDLIEKNPIYFIPIKVQSGNNIYTDRWDLIPEEFYRILNISHSFPKTSQPGLNDFIRRYHHLLIHYRSIISVHVSKALSGTFQTAVQASQSVSPERISVIDGKNVSVGLGLILMEGIKAIEQKKNHEEAVHMIKNAAMNTQIFIGLPTLKYLVKGGRVTKTKGFMAHLLNLNPILSISAEGKLIPVSKARGVKNLEKQVFDLIHQKKQKTVGGLSIAVAHTNAPDIGERISQRIKKDFQLEPVLVMNASPVLGAHAGPRAYGVALHYHSFATSDDTLND
ncbi:MAG: DegV family EDD domain-containing protein [Candidatus Aminicenantes bacterium]|nr:MAG: DegV family EDD domain-containing protein [Candidatus Aminicenantes bacterium]